MTTPTPLQPPTPTWSRAFARGRLTDPTIPTQGYETWDYDDSKNQWWRWGSSMGLLADAQECFGEAEFRVNVGDDWAGHQCFVGVAVHVDPADVIVSAAAASDAASAAAADADEFERGPPRAGIVMAAMARIYETPAYLGGGGLVIDHVSTRPWARRRGLATLLTDFCTRLVVTGGGVGGVGRRNLWVLSLEDAAPFWMERGFVLEPDPVFQRVLNHQYNDTHLLRHALNVQPAPPDASIPAAEENVDDGDDDKDMDEDEDDDEDPADPADELQRALWQSMQEQ